MSLCSLSTIVPNFFLVSILNSDLLFDYYREFVNCTVNIQINDIRQLPVIIPNQENLLHIKWFYNDLINLKQFWNNKEKIDEKEKNINFIVNKLYSI